ncbi:hypothetical protein D915_003773 [Fasciola hepatica]|uniref:Uncharacterized protein n=1 Tax=Fasciola hepatica TaxID=6192 RepID=A0A4E0RVX3_FASHE|nr:hypothetical protein D915_003773 [Fasciola hepatica]
MHAGLPVTCTWVLSSVLQHNIGSNALLKLPASSPFAIQKSDLVSYKDAQNTLFTLPELAVECQRLLKLKYDSTVLHNEQTRVPVNEVAATNLRSSNRSKLAVTTKSPSSTCRHCGNWNFHRE